MNFFENQWVEVFQSGKQTDSTGNSRNWVASDLEKIVKNYNTKKYEAPLVVGHPKDNAPAFGWVEELKTDGKTLFAKFKQLVPEFIEAVKQGLYKKRSISLYPDLTLRHIGFLGAVAPAVKGLSDIKFSENDSIIIEFNSQKEELSSMTEKKPCKDAEIENLKAQLKAEQSKNRRSEFNEFVNNLHSKGKLVSDFQSTVLDLMDTLYEVGEVNFSEGKANALDKFKNYLEKQPVMVDFEEKVKTDIVRQTTAFEQLNILALERSKEEGLSYSEALSAVQADNKDLAEKAAQEV